MNRVTSAGWDEPVYVDGVELDLAESLKVWNHSPSGFAWGYSGSGPAQLALAILLRFTDEYTAGALHQPFKREFVARWGQGGGGPGDRGPLDERVDVPGWIGWQLSAAEPGR